MRTLTALVNLWKDFNVTGRVRPYLGAGLGMGWSDIDLVIFEDPDPVDGRDLSLAAQVGAGIRFDLNNRFSVDLGYRFKALIDVNTDARLTDIPNPAV